IIPKTFQFQSTDLAVLIYSILSKLTCAQSIWGIMQMAQPTCLMRSFSQPSESSREFNEGDPARCLGESISFGRYMSEPLAWEKWSAFSNNRYLEEAEKSSKPGSVAKMKAYFEAYYKSLATRKRVAKDEEARKASDFEFNGLAEHSSCSVSHTPQEVDSASDKPSNREDCNLEYIAPLNALDSCVHLEVHCSDDFDSSPQLEEQHPSDGLEISLQLEREPSNELEQLKCTSEVDSSKEGDDPEKLNTKVKPGNSSIGRSAISKPPISLEMKLLKKGDDNQERLNLKIKKLPDSNFRKLPYCKPSKLLKPSGNVVTSQPRKEGCVTPRTKQQGKDNLHLKAMPSTYIQKSNKFGPHADVIKKSSQFVQRSLAYAVGKPKQTSATPRPDIGRSESTPGRSLSRGRARGQELLPPSLIMDLLYSSLEHCPEVPVLSDHLTATQSPLVQVDSNHVLLLHSRLSTSGLKKERQNVKRQESFPKAYFFLKQQEKEAEKSQQPEKAKERVNTARKLLSSIGLNAKSTVDNSVKSLRQEIYMHPNPRPLKQSDALKLKAGKNDVPRYQSPNSKFKKIRHENASPNIL
ncbi:hypothetical protein V2J09_013172, partial [Rumex salicifolius]